MRLAEEQQVQILEVSHVSNLEGCLRLGFVVLVAD